MNFSILSSFSGSLLWASIAMGIIFLFCGLVPLYRQATLRRPLQGTAFTILRSEAEHWQVPEVALDDFTYSQRRFACMFGMGMGLGSLLFAVIYALLLISPIWSLICPFNFGDFVISVWFLCFIIGGSVGGFYALHYLRREARGMRTGGPRRHLRDYRSPLFFLIPCVWFVLFCTLVFAFHPSYAPVAQCLNNDFPARLLPWRWWLVYPWFGLAFVALLSLEVLLSRFASARSPLVPTSIPGVVGIDDMFRGKIISIVQYMIIGQIVLFSEGFSVVVSYPYSMVAIIIPLLSLFPLLLLSSKSSGLGGKLTGWFWKRKRVA